MPKKCMSLLSPNDRPVHSAVRLLCWNPAIDLLAIATDNHVLVQRLFWKKAWQTLLSSDRSVRPRALCWTHDGSALLVGDSAGCIRMLAVETGRQTHLIECQDALKWMAWKDIESNSCVEEWPDLVPSLPVLDANPALKETERDIKWTEIVASEATEKHHSILISATENGVLTVWLNAVLPFIKIDLGKDLDSSNLLETRLDSKLQQCMIITQKEGAVHLSKINFPDRFCSSKTMWSLCRRRAKIGETLDYISSVCQRLKDGWEDLLLEIDRKFSKFAKEKFMSDGGSVGSDLVVLLVLGTASAELEHFLLHTLTEKGIKRVSEFLNISYQKLLDLVTLNLHSAVTGLNFHLVQMRGACEGKCWSLAVRDCGSLALKLSELRAVISHSRVQLRSFFQCLRRALVLLSNEHIPPELNVPVTHEDTEFVVQFIEDTFMKVWSDKQEGPLFRLEKVGQYLEDGPLAMPLDTSQNPWTELEERLLERPDPLVFKHELSCSLMDLVERVKEQVSKAETEMLDNSSTSTEIADSVLLSDKISEDGYKLQLSEDGNCCYLAAELPCTSVDFLSFEQNLTKTVRTISWDSEFELLDFDVYRENTIFALMRGTAGGFWLARLEMKEDQIHFEFDESNFAQLSQGPFVSLAVSSQRRVGCVLSECRTRIRLLDLEPDEESTTVLSCSANSMDI